jgi:GTP-binding protein HflX
MIGTFVSRRKSRKPNVDYTGCDRTRALVVGPYLDERAVRSGACRSSMAPLKRGIEARFAEVNGLAQAIDLHIVSSIIVPLTQIRPATYLGKGKLAEITEIVASQDIELVIMDCALSPGQQHNLEKALSAKVIDRTGLILEIFGQRAQTREGVLQVELAHLAYQKSRLVRSWTHLERQRGGFGFLGGPGETQIETDRRLIDERMHRIEQDLERVKRTRGLHRKSRRSVPFPIVALVGYTNAGKSSLFNRLTKSQVFAEDLLFATLDPTLRRLRLPHGSDVILSDTVGFISDLPTTLISAFRATLEEVLEADLILHVRDIAHEDAEAQQADVQRVLMDLGIDPHEDGRFMEVWNKADLLGEDEFLAAQSRARLRSQPTEPVLISALTGQGIDALLEAFEQRLSLDRRVFDLAIPPDDGASLNWLYENGEVTNRATAADGTVHVTVRIARERADHLRNRFRSQIDGAPCNEVVMP